MDPEALILDLRKRVAEDLGTTYWSVLLNQSGKCLYAGKVSDLDDKATISFRHYERPHYHSSTLLHYDFSLKLFLKLILLK